MALVRTWNASVTFDLAVIILLGIMPSIYMMQFNK